MAKTMTSTQKPRRKPITPEAREGLMISLAMDLAEKKLRDGTASNQLIVELIKRGSMKAQVELELLEKQRDLASAKTDSLKSAARSEELFEKAMKAMRRYSGHGDEDDDEFEY